MIHKLIWGYMSYATMPEHQIEADLDWISLFIFMASLSKHWLNQYSFIQDDYQKQSYEELPPT